MSQNDPRAPYNAQQGHRYSWFGKPVLALESGYYVRVMLFDPARPWICMITHARAYELDPQPMKYFHGEIPK